MRLPDGFLPQLVAIDLDDTLLPHDGVVPGRVAEAVARVQELGIMVVAATGRSMSTTLPVCRAAGMTDWAVCSNGALLAQIDPDEIVETIAFDPTDLLMTIRDRVPEGMYAVEDVHGLFRTNQAFTHSALAEGIREVPFEELLHEPAIRVVVRSDSHQETGLGPVAAELGLHSVVFGVADVAWLDIGPQGVSKATMLARLCDRLGIDPALTLTIGDSMNDIAMLQWAGVGVLMGHAVDEMRQYADVIAGHEPGYAVADVLDAIGA